MVIITETVDAPRDANALYTLSEGDTFVGVLRESEDFRVNTRDTIALNLLADRTYFLTDTVEGYDRVHLFDASGATYIWETTYSPREIVATSPPMASTT